MTREEAIEVLEYARNYDGMDYGAPSIALDMAISALRQQKTMTDSHQMTNADRIRAMSDKELAELMRSMMDCDSCGNMFSFKCDGSYEHCSSVCLKWLQMPAEEDDHD